MSKVNKHTKIKYKSSVVIIVFAVIIIAVFLLNLWFFGVTKKSYLDNEISSAEEFISVIKTNTVSGSEAEYTLSCDIELDEDDIAEIVTITNIHGNEGAIFYGTLDGGGHTITITATMNKPLFLQLASGSVIANLTIKNAVLADEGQSDGIAVLAKVNYGTIENVKLENVSITLYNNASNAAALAVYNFGVINYCVADAEVEIFASFISSEKVYVVWKSRFGVIAAQNGGAGSITNIIVSVSFPSDFVVLSLYHYNASNDVNQLVSYVAGSWVSAENIDDIYVVDGAYYDTAYDTKNLSATDVNISSISAAALTSVNFREWKSWKFADNGGSLPSL